MVSGLTRILTKYGHKIGKGEIMAKYEIVGYDRESGDKRVKLYESRSEENAILMAAEDGIVVDKCQVTIIQAEIPKGTPVQLNVPNYNPTHVQTNVQVVIPKEKRRGSLAGASLAFALLAMMGCWIPFVGVISAVFALIGLALGILALLICFLGKTRISSALAGIFFSAVALGIAIHTTGSVANEMERAEKAGQNSTAPAEK